MKNLGKLTLTNISYEQAQRLCDAEFSSIVWLNGKAYPTDDIEAVWQDNIELSQQLAQQPSNPPAIFTDCDCGCNELIATEPIKALEFLASRFEFSGVSNAVASYYARDIRKILADYAQQPSVDEWLPPETAPKDGTEILASVNGSVIIARWYVHYYNGKPNPNRPPEWEQETMFTTHGADYRGPIELDGWMPKPQAMNQAKPIEKDVKK